MTIRVFEAFAGVGSQRMALRNLGINHEVVAISDVDEFTVKSYAAIHDSDKTVLQVTDDEMQDYLEERNIPLNDKGVRKILKGDKLREFYEACIKSNNLGDISQIETADVPDHDLFTYSFPCQDISVAGKGLGLDEGGDTRSGLLWECQKVIYGKRPKYLLLENVKNLVGKKHKHNFDKWLEWLEKQGYTNYWQVLNAKDYGVPQNRERVFVVSILGHHELYEFPEPVKLELRLKDVLEDEVDEKFYLSQEIQDRLTLNPNFKNEIKTIGSTKGKENTRLGQRDVVYSDEGIMGALGATDYKQPKQILDSGIRKLSPLECWRLMGFSDDDFHKAAYELREITFKGGKESWNVKLADVTESQTHENMETFALNITKDLKGQEEILTEWIKSLKTPENEKGQSVNVVIEKLGELGHSDSATSIIRCTDYMETLTILMEEKDPLHTVIIELDPKVSTNTAKYMKITSEENLNPLKLSTILTLIEQIIESKIFISTLHKVNICGHISVTENLLSDTENQIELSLRTEAMFTRISASQLYKQAGNSIVVDVLEGIFKQLLEAAE